MSASDLRVKDAGIEGARLAVRWASWEGWNPGLHDAEAFFAADPHGFRIAYLHGEAVGTYSMVRYDEKHAFAGLYIAVKAVRGRGVGRAMLASLLKEAAPFNLGGDGVVAMVPTYERHGFRQQFRSGRMMGTIKGRKDASLRSLADVGLEAVEEYDRRMFLYPRRDFLKAFLTAPDTHAAVAVDGKGAVIGYGVLRQCVRGYKLAPLFADTPEAAERLLLELATYAPQEIYLDVPEPNKAGTAMASRYGMKEVFACARIYTKHFEPLPLDSTFGITSFELG
jgi:GNAT superfamily N-acetyltransferase